MSRDRIIQIVAIVLMLGFLAGGGVVATQVASSAGRNRLVYADSVEDGDPPEVALGIAMGAFRGIFVNWLWMRANDLKEEGKYYEAVDLAKTITRLQPRFPRVWAFHAWNLAYNISVATNTPQERWQWVRAGIELIRKEGIPANPGEVILYRELAWIHLHKIQAYMDDSHVYYKRQFAMEWQGVLGAPPRIPIEIKEAEARREYYVQNWLKAIDDAPASLSELYRLRPGARTIADRLAREAGVDISTAQGARQLLVGVEQLRSMQRTARNMGIERVSLPPGPLTSILTDEKLRDDGLVLLSTLRKVMLRDEYKMDIGRMIRYTRQYGPLDWRHASTHAVYWSSVGAEEARLRYNERNKDDIDLVNTDRMTIQGLQDLFRTGTLYFDPLNPDFYRQLPNLDYLESYGTAIENAASRDSVYEDTTRIYTQYQAGYENFLRDAVRYLFRRGDEARANEYYDLLRKNPYRNQHSQGLIEETNVTLAEFVKNEIAKDNRETSPVVALQEIEGSLTVAFTDGLLGQNQKVFESAMRYARLFHQVYTDSQNYKTFLAQQSGGQGRLAFPPFNFIAGQALARMIMEAGLVDGSIMYRMVPGTEDRVRGYAYVFLEASGLKEQIDAAAIAEAGGPDAIAGLPPEERPKGFDYWFPPPAPATLEMYRQEVRAAVSGPEGSGDVMEK